MLENEIRDLLALDLEVLEKGLRLLNKEQYIPPKVCTRSFIDLYATDCNGNHVLIELKRSDQAARQALHEVNKYIEAVKNHFGAKDSEIRVIIVSTEWNELLVPFSRFISESSITISGIQINVDTHAHAITGKEIVPMVITQGRFIADWCEVFWYENKISLDKGIDSIKYANQIKQIEDYVIVIFELSDSFVKAQQATLIESLESFGSNVEHYKIPGHRYIVYVAVQALTEEFCLNRIHSLEIDSESLEETLSYIEDMEGEELLCTLHESVYDLKPRPSSDSVEIGCPAKFSKFIDQFDWINCEVLRFGIFNRNKLLTDEVIISELKGEDGSTQQRFKRTFDLNNISQLSLAKSEIRNCLADNVIWRRQILNIIDDIQSQGGDTQLNVSVYTPNTGLFTLYYVLRGEVPDFLYLPAFQVFEEKDNVDCLYFGALEPSDRLLNYKQVIDKYYKGDISNLLMAATWGGKDSRDVDILEDIGLVYRTFKLEISGTERKLYRLENERWKPCENIDPFELFMKYCQDNEVFVRRLVSRISQSDNGAFFDFSSRTVELDDISDIDQANKRQEFYSGSPNNCDLCESDFVEEEYLIDGVIVNSGMWANMCLDCFVDFGEGIEWGKGQLYKKTNKGWLCVGGFCPDELVDIE